MSFLALLTTGLAGNLSVAFAQDYASVDTAALEAGLADENTIVIDARPNDVYIGWDVDGNARGGHIEGATDFSADWFTADYDDKNNLEGDSREDVLAEAMDAKGIDADKNIIIYDTNGEDAQAVADYLKEKGNENISLYDANEWINDDEKELISYPNYQLLIAPEKLNQIIAGEEVEGIATDKVVILDVSWGEEEESGYLEGHIPGAIHINTDSFEPPHEYVEGIEEWRLTDYETLLELLLANGITADTTVITTGPEPMASSRFAVVLKYMGVENVHVLNGGLVDWKNAGYELETEAVKPEPVEEFNVEVPANPELIVTMDQMVDELENNEELELLDVRTLEEYNGEVSGYSYHDKKGRLPGAKYARAGKNNSSSMSYYRNVDKTVRNREEFLQMWEDNDIDTTKDLIVYCGSGWRAAEAVWYANVYGIDNIRLFSDGWIAWSNEGLPGEGGDYADAEEETTEEDAE